MQNKTPCITKGRMRSLVKAIGKQRFQIRDQGMSFGSEALTLLHTSLESYMKNVIERAKQLSADKGRMTLTVQNIQSVMPFYDALKPYAPN